MCLLLLALNSVPRRPGCCSATATSSTRGRPRPRRPGPKHRMIGGRDLEAGGSWLALHRNGRYAAVTNVRSGTPQRGTALARRTRRRLRRGQRDAGRICSRDGRSAARRIRAVQSHRRRSSKPGCASSIDGRGRSSAGIHVFSNGPPEVDGRKHARLRERFLALYPAAGAGTASPNAAIVRAARPDDAALLDLLFDVSQQPDDATCRTPAWPSISSASSRRSSSAASNTARAPARWPMRARWRPRPARTPFRSAGAPLARIADRNLRTLRKRPIAAKNAMTSTEDLILRSSRATMA